MFAAFEQDSNEMRSDESGSSCNEYGHRGVNVLLRHRLVASSVSDVNNIGAFAVVMDAVRTEDMRQNVPLEPWGY